MSRIIVLLIVLFFIRALGEYDNANAPVDAEFDSDDWSYDTDPDLRGVRILGWVAVGCAVFITVAGLIWEYTHPPPPPPPVDASASVDELKPSPGIPNQFVGFASSGMMGSEWGDFRGIDDEISPNYEERGVKSQLVVLRAELESMKMENQHLRDLLNQVRPSQ